MILSFCGHPTKNNQVQLSIHQDIQPYKIIKQLEFANYYHYEYAAVPSDRRQEPSDLYFAMCTTVEDAEPCKVSRLVKGEQDWTHTSVIVKNKDGNAT